MHPSHCIHSIHSIPPYTPYISYTLTPNSSCQDALDTFASNVSNKTLRLALAEEIAVQLNLNKSTVSK